MLRSSRQGEIVKSLSGYSALVIGVGSIGSNAVHMLVSTGVEDVTIVDPDKVEEVNIWPAFFSEEDIDAEKTTALSEWALKWHSLQLDSFKGRIENFESERQYDLVIIGTDDMESRRRAWSMASALSHRNGFWMDGRMGAHLADMYCIPLSDPLKRGEYIKSLIAHETVALPCGQKATAPLTKGFIPGFIGQCLYSIANNLPPPFLQKYDLKNALCVTIP